MQIETNSLITEAKRMWNGNDFIERSFEDIMINKGFPAKENISQIVSDLDLDATVNKIQALNKEIQIHRAFSNADNFWWVANGFNCSNYDAIKKITNTYLRLFDCRTFWWKLRKL